jgi:hypothetical protein
MLSRRQPYFLKLCLHAFLISSACPLASLLSHPFVNRSGATVVHHDELFACSAWSCSGRERRCADVQLQPDWSLWRLLRSSDDLSERTVYLLPDWCSAWIHSCHQEHGCRIQCPMSVHYARIGIHRHLLSARIGHQYPKRRSHCFVHQLESRPAYANPVLRHFRPVTSSQSGDRDYWCRGYLYRHLYTYCESRFRLHRYGIRRWCNSDLH